MKTLKMKGKKSKMIKNLSRQMMLVCLMVLLLVSCTPKNIEEKNHMHSISFDPTEPGFMYVATHYYLEKVNLQTKMKEQVGRYGDDYMGFVVAADGTFYSSGHSPDVPNVGIRKSMDKGKRWKTLAYEGYDFHDITTGVKVIYAWSTPPEEFLAVSSDDGENWARVSAVNKIRGSIFVLEADKQQPDKVYAGSLFGLFVSEDTGKSWLQNENVKNIAVVAIADDPRNEWKVTLATAEKILQTQDGGKTWDDISGKFDQKEEVIIFLTTDPATEKIYGVTKHSKIYAFDNQEWKEFYLNQKEGVKQ